MMREAEYVLNQEAIEPARRHALQMERAALCGSILIMADDEAAIVGPLTSAEPCPYCRAPLSTFTIVAGRVSRVARVFEWAAFGAEEFRVQVLESEMPAGYRLFRCAECELTFSTPGEVTCPA